MKRQYTFNIYENMFKLIAILGLAVIASSDNAVVLDDANSPIITTSRGQLQGERLECGIFCHYYSFKGVPYAEPPIGDLRFRSPVPIAPWQGVRQATAHGNVCTQPSDVVPVGYVGTEDCLFLNIYTQDLIGSRPVMVFIHGGGFVDGSGDVNWYGPDYIVQDGVLLVTINYRVGIFGFLSTGDRYAQGNYGMKDMVEALRWVQENIAAFGGDPSNVTIFGESAGAVSIHYLVLSAMTAGLFHKAIAQSGSALNPWGYQPNPNARAVALGERLGLTATTSEALIAAIRQLPANQLVLETPEWTLPRGFRPFEFSIAVEPMDVDEPRFLTAPPHEIILNDDFNHVPFMLGYNDAESQFMIHEEPLFDDSNPENLVPVLWNVAEGSPASTAIANAFRQFYFNGGLVSDDLRFELTEFQTDQMFIYGIDRTVRLHAARQDEPVYYYMFTYTGDLNGFKIAGGLQNYPGAVHGDDLYYLFTFEGVGLDVPANSPAFEIRRRLIRLWTNFSKYTNPSHTLDDLVNVAWPAVTSAHEYMNIGAQLNPGFNPMIARMNLWNELAEQYANF